MYALVAAHDRARGNRNREQEQGRSEDAGPAARLDDADGGVEDDGDGAGLPGDKGFALKVEAKGGAEVVVRHVNPTRFNIGTTKAQVGEEANHKVCIGVARTDGSRGNLARALVRVKTTVFL